MSDLRSTYAKAKCRFAEPIFLRLHQPDGRVIIPVVKQLCGSTLCLAQAWLLLRLLLLRHKPPIRLQGESVLPAAAVKGLLQAQIFIFRHIGAVPGPPRYKSMA